MAQSKDLTLGYFRELTKNLPDDTMIVECDYDQASLVCTVEQFILDCQFVMFISNKCYSRWQEVDFKDIDKPIPGEWKL